jgi:hypothetical protein
LVISKQANEEKQVIVKLTFIILKIMFDLSCIQQLVKYEWSVAHSIS